MTVTGVSPQLAPLVQSVLNVNKQLTTLQQQLSSGEKSDTYGGLGAQSGIAVALNAQLSALSSYDDTITNVGTSISLQQQVLQQLAKSASTVQDSTVQQLSGFSIDSTGQTTVQKSAQDELGLMLNSLNTQGGNGYLFSGNGIDQPAVDTADHILNGNGAAAGLEQVIAERNQADLGSNGLGRLVIPAAVGSTVSVSEDVAGSPFGLKLASVNSSLTNASVTGPTGSPASISVDMSGGNPNNGDSITFTFSMPDGTSQAMSLQATTSTTPAAGQFTIGATPAATAANMQAALTAGVSQMASTSLSAASAMEASNDFFGNPPLRVSGSPPSSATALVNGTSANTVMWYTGNNATGSIRDSQTARVDQTTTVSYGTQANEQGIRWLVQNVATLAATSYSTSDPNAAASYSALSQRVYAALGVPSGVQKVDDIEASLANAQNTMSSAQDQHAQTSTTLSGMLQSIEGVDPTQVGAQILSLQTILQASLSTTARMAQLNLLAYLAPVSG
jgi:flagellin-like hook-associated protein FlgL